MTRLFLNNGLTTKVCDRPCGSKSCLEQAWLNILLKACVCWLQPGSDLFVVSCRGGRGGGGGFSLIFFVGGSVTKDEGLQALKYFFS